MFISPSIHDAFLLPEKLERRRDDRARLVYMSLNTAGLCVIVS
jgi:hypothetical protein